MYPGVLPRTLTTLNGHCIVWSSLSHHYFHHSVHISIYYLLLLKPKNFYKKPAKNLKSAHLLSPGLGYKTSMPFRSLVSWSSWRRPHQEYSACPHDEGRRLLAAAVPRLLCCPPSNYFSIAPRVSLNCRLQLVVDNCHTTLTDLLSHQIALMMKTSSLGHQLRNLLYGLESL